MGGCNDLKILVGNNPTILIICKNSLSKINTRSNITLSLDYCKTIFKDYYPEYKYFNNSEIHHYILNLDASTF